MFQGFILRTCRTIHTTALRWQAPDKAVLSKLRKKTGFPIAKCQKALVMFENDLGKAEGWLKEQALKEGWSKAQKLQDRPMSQGLVGVTLNNNVAVMVEVNCETDFVARNPKFQSVVSTAALSCLKYAESVSQNRIALKKAELDQLRGADNKTLADLLALSVGDLGENMAIRRAVVMQATEGLQLGTYVHSTGQKEVTNDKCIMGKYGAIVVFRQSEVTEGVLPPGELGKQLCQHVVGMNPVTLGMEDLVAMETKEEDQTEEQEDESKKKKRRKSKKKKKKEDDEETRLLFQEFLLDPDLKVKDFLEQNNAKVEDFARLECGEVLEE